MTSNILSVSNEYFRPYCLNDVVSLQIKSSVIDVFFFSVNATKAYLEKKIQVLSTGVEPIYH